MNAGPDKFGCAAAVKARSADFANAVGSGHFSDRSGRIFYQRFVRTPKNSVTDVDLILTNDINCRLYFFAAVYAVTLNSCLWQLLSVTSITPTGMINDRDIYINPCEYWILCRLSWKAAGQAVARQSKCDYVGYM